MLLLLFLVFFSNFFTRPIDNENVRLRLALAIPTGVSVTVANDTIEMLPLVGDKKNYRLIKIIKRSSALGKSFAH